MIDIDEYIVTTVINDSTMISLLGITASDNRIYAWYPTLDVVFDDSVSIGAIVFRSSMNSRGGNFSYPYQLPNLNYFFRCMSNSQLVSGQIAERMMDLFDEKYNIFLDNFGIKKIGMIGKSEAPTEGDAGNPIYVKLVSFSFSNLFRRYGNSDVLVLTGIDSILE